LGSWVCGERFIAVGPLNIYAHTHTHAHMHTCTYIYQRFFKGRKKGQLAKKSEGAIKGYESKGRGREGRKEGDSKRKGKEKVTRGIHTVNFVAPLSIPRDRGTALCILFISSVKRGNAATGSNERSDRDEHVRANCTRQGCMLQQ